MTRPSSTVRRLALTYQRLVARATTTSRPNKKCGKIHLVLVLPRKSIRPLSSPGTGPPLHPFPTSVQINPTPPPCNLLPTYHSPSPHPFKPFKPFPTHPQRSVSCCPGTRNDSPLFRPGLPRDGRREAHRNGPSVDAEHKGNTNGTRDKNQDNQIQTREVRKKARESEKHNRGS